MMNRFKLAGVALALGSIAPSCVVLRSRLDGSVTVEDAAEGGAEASIEAGGDAPGPLEAGADGAPILDVAPGPDAGPADTMPAADVAVADVAVTDVVVADVGTPDAGAGDAGTADAGDAGTADAGDDGLLSAELRVFELALRMPVITSDFGSGHFLRDPIPARGPDGCTREVSGECELSRCPRSAPVTPTGATVSAGRITVSGGTGEAREFRSLPDGSYSYEGVAGLDLPTRWNDNDVVRIVATGGDVPAFSVMGRFPTNFRMLDPELVMTSYPAATRLRRATGLTMRWAGLTDETVALGITASTTTEQALVINCSFRGSAGTGVVPAGLTSQLTALDRNEGGLSLAAVRTYEQVVGRHRLRTFLTVQVFGSSIFLD